MRQVQYLNLGVEKQQMKRQEDLTPIFLEQKVCQKEKIKTAVAKLIELVLTLNNR